MDHSNPAPVIFLAAISMALVLNFLYPYLCDVRLGATNVEFVMFKSIVVWAIPRDEIIRFDKVSFLEGALLSISQAGYSDSAFCLPVTEASFDASP
jgi:hypothetical protein